MTAVRCTCVEGFPQSVAKCPMHGQRTPQAATGTQPEGEAGSVPVVDITALIRGLYEEAEDVRVRRLAFLDSAHALAASYARQADHLEALAGTLDGMTP